MQIHYSIVDMFLDISILILALNLINFKFKTSYNKRSNFYSPSRFFPVPAVSIPCLCTSVSPLIFTQIQKTFFSNSSSSNYLQLCFFHRFQTKSFSGPKTLRHFTSLKLDSFQEKGHNLSFTTPNDPKFVAKFP